VAAEVTAAHLHRRQHLHPLRRRRQHPRRPQPPRETEILALMAGGFNNREIGDVLGTSEGTVKNQVSSILSKLGVRDRVRAVLRGLELGYI